MLSSIFQTCQVLILFQVPAKLKHVKCYKVIKLKKSIKQVEENQAWICQSVPRNKDPKHIIDFDFVNKKMKSRFSFTCHDPMASFWSMKMKKIVIMVSCVGSITSSVQKGPLPLTKPTL